MIKKTTLSNGVRVISELMPEAYSATVMLWANVGPNLEKVELNGISHFIEHMMFKGTKNRSAREIVKAIEDTGGSINAFTDKETTCYYVRMLTEHIPVAIDILLDMAYNSEYNDKDIEIERQVILEEIKMYEDTPDELVHDSLIQSYWHDHPLGRPIIGSKETVLNITKDNMINFANDHYTAENIIISIAGNFDEEKILSQIEKSVQGIKASSPSTFTHPPVTTPRINYLDKDIEQSHICLGTKGVSILDDDRYVLAIIDICLGGGMSSRLFQEIREKRGLVYSINTYEALYRQAGIFGVYAGTNPKNVQDVIKLIIDEFERFKASGLTDDELLRAKIQIKGGLLIGMESTKHRASRNGRSTLYFDKVFEIEEICRIIDRITHQDINRLSNSILDKKYMGISLVGPKVAKYKELSLDQI